MKIEKTKSKKNNSTRSVALNLDRLFKYVMIIIPVGVLVNLGFAHATTDREIFKVLPSFEINYLFLAMGLSLAPLLINSLRLGIWTRFLAPG